MGNKTVIHAYLDEDNVERIVRALRMIGGSLGPTAKERHLADRLEGEVRTQRALDEIARQEAERLATERAKRAADFLLTRVQADCLAAVRAGMGHWMRYKPGGVLGDWHRTRSMGGAARRLRDRLVEEGLLDERPTKLTAAGLARLEAWEKAHFAFPKE